VFYYSRLFWYTGLVKELYIRKPNTICQICHKKIYRRPGQIKNGTVFCSQKCYGIYCRKEIPCLVCGVPILSDLNKKTCSRKCANIYRTGINYKIGRPKDLAKKARSLKIKLFKKRGVVCERCGYSNQSILQIHHKNRKRNDNKEENLEILCPNCHYEEHILKNRGILKKTPK